MKSASIYFLTLLFLLSMNSCGKDDPMSTTSEFAGTWKAQSFGGNVNASSEFDGMTATTTTTFDGRNIDYLLSMTDTTFATMGSYEIAISTQAQGTTNTTSDIYTNVSGDGIFSKSGDQLFVTGKLFDLEINGMPFMTGSGPQVATYNISGSIMTIMQSDTSSTDSGGVLTSSETSFISTWKKQ